MKETYIIGMTSLLNEMFREILHIFDSIQIYIPANYTLADNRPCDTIVHGNIMGLCALNVNRNSWLNGNIMGLLIDYTYQNKRYFPSLV